MRTRNVSSKWQGSNSNRWKINPRGIDEQLNSDKKVFSGRVRWVLPKATGEIFLADQVPRDVVLNAMIQPGKGDH